METVRQDVKYGARLLFNNPGFALVAVLTLALGLGANTTIFSWLNSILINPIPGARDQQELVIVVPRSPTFRVSSFSYPDFVDYRKENTVFQGLAIHDFAAVNLGGEVNPERIYAEVVSSNFFDVLGVKALHGRTFLAEEDTGFGEHPVLVISYPLWQRRFGGDPGVVGKTVPVNRLPYTIVGVAPRGFQGGEIALSFDAWIPITMYSQVAGGEGYKYRGNHSFASLARLKPGVDIQEAQAGLEVIARQLARQYPETNDKWSVAVYPLWNAPYGAVEILGTVLMVLMSTVGVLLLIVCANVANLLLARAAQRRREIAIRLSLGASRGRLLRQLLTESLLLSLLGGLAGIMVSLWTSRLLMLLTPPSDLPIQVQIHIDYRVLLFALALSLVTGIVFGLAPALESSRVSIVTSIKEGSATPGWRWRTAWLRNTLVVSQIALSMVLLVAATLFTQSLDSARRMKLGFQPKNVLLAQLDLFSSGYGDDQGRSFYTQLQERIEALPGVRGVTLARRVPLGFGGQASSTIQVEGYSPARDEIVWSCIERVGRDYFRVMEISMVRGRDINRWDARDAAPVAVINETLARRYWQGSDPVGRRISYAGRWITVVGIAHDSKYRNLSEPPTPYTFLPVQQQYASTVTLFVRTEGDPARMTSGVTGIVRAMDPAIPLSAVRTFEAHIGAAAFQQRMASVLLVAFGTVALVLAAIGVFGIISYTVTQQTREFGIRIALGARPHDLLWSVIRRGLALAAAGIMIGLPAAWAAARLTRSLLLGVNAADPLTFVGVTLLLSATAVAACVIPARRAAAVDPSVSLRYE
jgi:predicted permease